MILGSLTFLTPAAAAVAVVVVVPVAALALALRRERAGRRVLGLTDPPAGRTWAAAVALALVPSLLAVAAAQPAIRSSAALRVRSDAEVLFVLDNSRSMLAAGSPGGPTRLARARAGAISLRDGLADLPAGVATLGDHLIPHLFPVADPAVFEQTVLHATTVEEPPPTSTEVVATSLDALGALGTQNYFTPGARRRIAIVLTDGESRPLDVQQTARSLGQRPGVHVIFVHVWSASETVYGPGGRPELGYHVDAGSSRTLESLAQAAGGSVFGEHDLGGALRAARAAAGQGPTTVEGTTVRTRTLAPYVALGALLPLLVVLGRAWGRGRLPRPRRARPLSAPGALPGLRRAA